MTFDHRVFRAGLHERALSKRYRQRWSDSLTASAARNIGVGWVKDVDNTQRIVAAAQAARADHLIDLLPQGYDTMLSRQYRDGVDLSRGQWQRICLARLFMKNAQILLFDEPTASLDIESEANLLREIAAIGADRLCILISHRILRSDLADRILVMEDGLVVEEGDHTHLIHRGGTYARLWRMYHTLEGSSSAHAPRAVQAGMETGRIARR